jgi:hypothetical protein
MVMADLDPDMDYIFEALKVTPRAKLLALEATVETIARVKLATTEICDGRMKTGSVFQLTAHRTDIQGNKKEYEQFVDQIIVLSLRRAQFWTKMKNEPLVFH